MGDRPITRIVILGGGFAGVAARRLERLHHRRSGVEVTLVSRDNFFVLTPLLFEACSGRLELRHCTQPLRPALDRTRFVEAVVDRVDVERRVVHASAPRSTICPMTMSWSRSAPRPTRRSSPAPLAR